MSAKRLGKGLDALIPSLHINEDDKIVEIPLTQLRANPYQPRKTFDSKLIEELAASIKEHGVITPIIVREVLKGYEIIAGERRWRASQLSNKATIPAVVRKLTDQQVMEIALIENVQREDLNAMEIALAYNALMTQFNLTQEELSVKVGKSRSHIANFMRLLQLPEQVKQYVSRGTLTMGHAKAIAGLKDVKKIKEIADLTIKNEWSVRELEEFVQRLEQPPETVKKPKKPKRDPYISSVEESLQGFFKTKVSIKANRNKGKIELLYYSKEDLERLLELLQSGKNDDN